MKRFTLCLASLFVLTSLSAYADGKHGTYGEDPNAPEYCKLPATGGPLHEPCYEPLMLEDNSVDKYKFGYAEQDTGGYLNEETWNNAVIAASNQSKITCDSNLAKDKKGVCKYIGGYFDYNTLGGSVKRIKTLTCTDKECDPAKAVMYVIKKNDGGFKTQGHCVLHPDVNYCPPDKCKGCDVCLPSLVWLDKLTGDYIWKEMGPGGEDFTKIRTLDEKFLRNLPWEKLGFQQACTCFKGDGSVITISPQEIPTTPTETNVCLATVTNLKVTYGRCWLYLSEFYLYEEDVPQKPSNWDGMSTTAKQKWCVDNAKEVLKNKANDFVAKIEDWAEKEGVDCNAGSQGLSVGEDVANGAVRIGMFGANYSYNDDRSSARAKISKFIKGVDNSKKSAWKTAEGKFNTARLASDLTAGVVLGTVGGVVSGVVIKKKQVEKGFDALHCSVGGQPIADWGDTFNVGLRSY